MSRKNLSEEIGARIIDVLKTHSQASLSLPQILAALGMQPHDRHILLAEVKRMLDQGLLIKTTGKCYGLPERLNCLTGVLQGNRRGFAFLRPDSRNEDVFIKAKNMNNSAHGDRVVVRIDRKKKKRHREGTVIGIIERGQKHIIGTLFREGKKYLVFPDDQRFPGSIQVSMKGLQKIAAGNKVVAEIEEWSHGKQPSRGRVVEHIGPVGSVDTEQKTFGYRYDLPDEFPKAVLKSLESLPDESDLPGLVAEENRNDLRDLPMVTIDDELARDFDDAVSLERTDHGFYRLGVHIADVSSYVREGKAIDREAFKRGTSTYLVDRVIHMLPPLLSEQLCSLQAGKDRLAFSVFMDIDLQGEVIGVNIIPSLISVNERLTYQLVEQYISDRQQKLLFKDQSLPAMFDLMVDLAGILRNRRLERGALDLDLPEARIVVDQDGVPLSVEKRSMGNSESLIEEFMICCNETVAGYLFEKKMPCIYRVHPVPTAEKLSMLRETLTLMGVQSVARIKTLKPKHLYRLLEETRGEKTEKLVRYLVLRSLPQAYYSAVNEGHYGLASGFYCHFTSPIRRYPDLIVHRILKQVVISGDFNPEKRKRLQARLLSVAHQASVRERLAIEAERASADIKKAQYMEQKIGEIYSGIINGVTNFGIFVELDNTIEGMIPISEVDNDSYVYHEKSAALVGERTRKTFKLGDSIRVQVVRANREEGKVTFGLADE